MALNLYFWGLWVSNVFGGVGDHYMELGVFKNFYN